MVKQKKKSWWDRLEVPLASLALAATVFGALRQSGHLAQWQQNNTPWSVANIPGAAAGPPARKKQRLTPGPTGLQVTANALAPVMRAATAVPAAAAHAAVSATLGPVAADVAASEGRRIAAAVIASVLSPTSGAAAPAVSVPAVIVPTTTGGVVAVPKVQRPVRMEGITRPSRRAASTPKLPPMPAVRMDWAPQLAAVRQIAAQPLPQPAAPVVPMDWAPPPHMAAAMAAVAPPRRPLFRARTADMSGDVTRSVRQRRGDVPYALPKSWQRRQRPQQGYAEGERTVVPRLPGMDNVRDQ